VKIDQVIDPVELRLKLVYYATFGYAVAEGCEHYIDQSRRYLSRGARRSPMSMDKSLKRTSQLVRQRSVLTRAERISRLVAEERWTDNSRPLGLPKVKVLRAVLKKAKKAAKEEAAEGAAAPAEGAAPAAAAPAAGAKGAKPAAAAKGAAAKPAAKAGGK
jgi:small basic protein (TIGR04137 family)